MYKQSNTASGATGCGPAFNRGGFAFHGKHHGGRHGGPWEGAFRRPKYNVPINITEAESAFEVHVYATGFAKEDVKITVTDDLLYISGTRTIDEGNNPNFSRQEFPIKSFERTLDLNGQVDINAISAKQENGILVIHLPKTADAKKSEHKIEVK